MVRTEIARRFGWFLLAFTTIGAATAQAPAGASQPSTSAAPPATHTLTNPLLPSGPDPWVILRDGFFYYMNTTGGDLTIWKTRRIEDLGTATKKIVWSPPETGPYSHDIWAPELHFLRGKWYIYFAADDGSNQTHRIFVLENGASDPTTGTWTFKGRLADATDRWAIDPTILREGKKEYVIWSGWEGAENGVQGIYIAELDNPWTIRGKRTLLSHSEYPWEKVGDLPNARDPREPLHVDVNEGPEILQHNGQTFLVYSADGCWTDYYELGMLTQKPGSDPLEASSWTKTPTPVFRGSADRGVYAPGHNAFFRSPDGKEDWILYHANPGPGQGCDGQRSPRAQRFSWKPDGTPDFGEPISAGSPVPPPSGEAAQ